MQTKYPSGSSGFTLIEIMVVVTTIGILAMLGIPSIRTASERTEATAAAKDIRVFTEALEFYSATEGSYPTAMTYTRIPEEIAEYLPSIWKNGSYSWFYVNTNSLIYIYVYNLNFSTEQAIRLDSIIDDGNIATGDIRIAFNGSGLIYVFSEQQS